jgi:hypothetical protein
MESRLDDFGKEELRGGLFSSPTSQYWQPYSGIEDYELKERITAKISGGYKPSAGVIF